MRTLSAEKPRFATLGIGHGVCSGQRPNLACRGCSVGTVPLSGPRCTRVSISLSRKSWTQGMASWVAGQAPS